MAVPSALAQALQGRYRLERELGRGGMATVYLAHDLRHERPVALKVLHPELARALGADRFLREIKSAARLQHPNILSVYDSGEAAGRFWFTMPYVEGESLRDRLRRERQLPVDDAIRIAREAAEALDYAHRHGLVHRDIKPENILLSEGHALVVDFGISRALGAGEPEERLTETGLVVGTPTYMSPEQATGERMLDGHTDIYSLGVVLYEMLAGEPPYTGPTPQAIAAKRLTQPVSSIRITRPTVSEPVDHAVQRALAPVPADRFATAAEFSRALAQANTAPTGSAAPARPAAEHRPRAPLAVALGLGFLLGLGVLFGWLRSHGGRDIDPDTVSKRVVVLPFQSLGDASDRAFAAGISEEITTRLARVPGLSLIARSSALEYPRSRQTAPQFGRTLGVEYVLDGTVRSAAGPGGQRQLRITPELIRVADGTHVWGEPYDGATGDVFRLQSDVAERVAVALQGKLESSEQRAVRTGSTDDLEAFRLYSLGRAEWNRRAPGSMERAADYFQQAIARDPGFARAWAGLAEAYALFHYYRVPGLPRDTAYARAKAAALKAIALDSTLAEPHAALNQILRYGYWDWAGSEREIRRAIALDPNYATAHQWLGEHLLDLGRLPEALAEARIAVQLDPLSRATQNCLGVALWFSGRIDEAIPVFRAAIERDSALGAPWFSLMDIYIQTGRTEEALALLDARHDTTALARAVVLARRSPAARAAALGRVGKAPGLPHVQRARFYARLGDREPAFGELDKAIADRDGTLEWIKVDPAWESLRGDPRFARIVARIGLPP
ncbi:MAG: protein kinase domain-containing protein [Gemmatimonadales bacterium]